MMGHWAAAGQHGKGALYTLVPDAQIGVLCHHPFTHVYEAAM